MKKLILLMYVIGLVSLISYASQDIPLSSNDDPAYYDPQRRTPPVVPAVDYEGEVFTVSTPLVVECVPFTICDEDGAVVYSSTDCAASRTHSFSVITLIPGDSYTVEVTIGSVTWTGDFTYTK